MSCRFCALRHRASCARFPCETSRPGRGSQPKRREEKPRHAESMTLKFSGLHEFSACASCASPLCRAARQLRAHVRHVRRWHFLESWQASSKSQTGLEAQSAEPFASACLFSLAARRRSGSQRWPSTAYKFACCEAQLLHPGTHTDPAHQKTKRKLETDRWRTGEHHCWGGL